MSGHTRLFLLQITKSVLIQCLVSVSHAWLHLCYFFSMKKSFTKQWDGVYLKMSEGEISHPAPSCFAFA